MANRLGTGPASGWTSLLLIAIGAVGLSGASFAADVDETVFVELKCNKCHSVEALGIEARAKSEKMRGPDLSDVGSQRDAEWFAGFLKREIQIDEKDHKKEFDGSKKQLIAIVDWLLEQRAGRGETEGEPE